MYILVPIDYSPTGVLQQTEKAKRRLFEHQRVVQRAVLTGAYNIIILYAQLSLAALVSVLVHPVNALQEESSLDADDAEDYDKGPIHAPLRDPSNPEDWTDDDQHGGSDGSCPIPSLPYQTRSTAFGRFLDRFL